FRNLQLAFDALNRGGNAPCIINAANEVAVDAFLHDKIHFLDMADIVESCLTYATFVPSPTYDDYVQSDAEVRRLANERIKSSV
ncbi:MAG: 1-deoxy-D-xylulose-5-phosphate reductoisomerase, partial [Cytophagaceae bacterium]